MEIHPIPLPETLATEAVPARIEQTFTTLGLIIALRTTLKAHPGAIHWHIRRPRQSGTLEITYDPNSHRAWYSTRAGRTKEWVVAMMEQVTTEITATGN